MKLYKYFDAEKFNLIFRKEGISLRVSQISALNDPFESKINFYNHLKKEMEKAYSKKKGKDPKKNLKIKTSLEEKLKIGMSTIDSDTYKVLESSYGITSFTTTHLNKLMWSHYGDSHKGFCIEFEVDESEFKGKLFKVDYESEPKNYPKNLMSLPSDEKISFMINVIKTKDDIWSYEDEYRLILDFKNIEPEQANSTPPLYTMTLRPKYVLRIIFGCMCDQKNIDDVKDWVLKYGATHIKLSKVTLSSERYELALKNIT